MKIACIQQIARDITEYKQAWQDVMRLIDQAAEKEVDLIVLPESCFPAYFLGLDEEKSDEALEYVDQVVKDIKDKARNYGVYIAAGVVIKEGDKKFNGGILVDKEGGIISTTRKSNLWHFDHKWFESGDIAEVVDTEFGKVGLMICADGRAPEIPRILALRGAEVIIDLANLTSTGRDPAKLSNAQLDYMLSTRALENNTWLIMADKIGLEANTVLYAGGSCVINPDGEIEQKASPNQEEILFADIELSKAGGLPYEREPADYSILAEETKNLPIYKSMSQPVNIAEADFQISAVQYEYETGSLTSYLEKVEKFIPQLEIQDSKMVVLPQLDENLELKEVVKGVKDIITSEDTVVILTGYTTKGDKLYKESLVFSRNKDYGYYDKVHTFKEELDSGDLDKGVVETPYGKIGLMMDNEGFLPEVPRKLMLMGAELIVWSDKEHHSKKEIVLQSRAAENKIFVVRAGDNSLREGCYIATPDGNIIAATLPDIDQAISKLVVLPYALAKNVVPGTNVVSDRRPELYKELIT